MAGPDRNIKIYHVVEDASNASETSKSENGGERLYFGSGGRGRLGGGPGQGGS